MPLRLDRPFAYHNHPREIIRQFTPNWFTVTMGTGIVSLALNQFPVSFPLLHVAAVAFWIASMLLFAVCTLLYVARWIFFSREAMLIFEHPVMLMFLGAIPMGLATMTNGFLAFGMPLIGHACVQIALVLWGAAATLAVGTGVFVPFLMSTRQVHSIESMTAVWLLPIVPAATAAASGGQLLVHLSNPEMAAHVMVFSYLLWAFSVPLALGILVILFLRLVLHKLPQRDMAVSSWLALGPLGTGALGLLVLGQHAPAILGAVGLGDVGLVAHGIGVIGGLILWGYGAWWFVMAAAITLTYVKDGLPFNMGWWAFTFPLGVFTLATLNLGVQTGMNFFTVLGGALTVLLLGFWIIVSLRTVAGGYRGHLFHSPCLAAREALARKHELTTWPT